MENRSLILTETKMSEEKIGNQDMKKRGEEKRRKVPVPERNPSFLFCLRLFWKLRGIKRILDRRFTWISDAIVLVVLRNPPFTATNPPLQLFCRHLSLLISPFYSHLGYRTSDLVFQNNTHVITPSLFHRRKVHRYSACSVIQGAGSFHYKILSRVKKGDKLCIGHNMSQKKSKSPGWAAFDLKQRQKESFDTKVGNEKYPPIPSSITRPHFCQNFPQNNNVPVKNFSSVVITPAQFPKLTDDQDRRTLLATGNSSATQSNSVNGETDLLHPYVKLKQLHSWADDTLIEDIMAAVDNDVSKASSLLVQMVSSESFEQSKDNNVEESDSNFVRSCLDPLRMQADEGISFGDPTDLAKLIRVRENCLTCNNQELTANHASCRKNSSDFSAAHTKSILGHLRSVPVEPEWEDDDIYLIHRKDAMRVMRSASQFSRAATDAYLRGDHFSAQQFSVKAREKRMAAEELNAKAAKEILSIRNGTNGLWKLDLHGLHAVEAVQALQQRLHKLESVVPLDEPVSPNRNVKEAGILDSASVESLCCTEMEKLDELHALSRQRPPSLPQRPTSLHVITGIGNHSREQAAALPTAVKSFLNENRYRFEEARPGLITVRPKFRSQ